MILKYKFIFLILIVAAFLRLYNLGSYPALNADEAAIGYNAYSLIQTGLDEHGNPWPIHFQSFNDYKPGGYFYMVLPFVGFLGLNPLSVRLPSAMFGIFTVLIIYLLTKRITRSIKTALLAALFLAVSPWHLHFSRGGWEVNVATFFIITGVYIFIKGVRDNKYLPLSILSFVVSLYTYHAARVIVPLIGLSLILIYRRKLFEKENLKLLLGSIIFGTVLLVPLANDFVKDAGSARATGVSIFADRGYIDRVNEARGRFNDPTSLSAKIIHNKPKEIVLEFSRNYLEHFWGEFLFLSGDDIERNKVPEVGQLYLFQAPLILLSLVAISRKPKGWKIILAWLLIAPIPAALTFQSPHALRAQSMVIPLTIISAHGMSVFLNFIKQIKIKQLISFSYIFIALVFTWSVSRYLHQYYVHMAKTYPYSSQYGVEEMVSFVESNFNKYDKFVITTRYDQPYILYLFYSKYSPSKFQASHVLTEKDQFGFSTVNEFDKLIFKNIDFEEDKIKYNRALIVGTDEEILDEANIIKEIYGTNGFLYFQAVAN